MKCGKRIHKWTKRARHGTKEPGSLAFISYFYLGMFLVIRTVTAAPESQSVLDSATRERKGSHRHRQYHHEVSPSNILICTSLKAQLKVIKIYLRYIPCSTKASSTHELGAAATHACVLIPAALEKTVRVINAYPTLPFKPKTSIFLPLACSSEALLKNRKQNFSFKN